MACDCGSCIDCQSLYSIPQQATYDDTSLVTQVLNLTTATTVLISQVASIYDRINKQATAHAFQPINPVALAIAPIDIVSLVIDGTNNHDAVMITARIGIINPTTAPSIILAKLLDNSGLVVIDEAIPTIMETPDFTLFSPPETALVGDSRFIINLSGIYLNYIAGESVKLNISGFPGTQAEFGMITAISKLNSI